MQILRCLYRGHNSLLLNASDIGSHAGSIACLQFVRVSLVSFPLCLCFSRYVDSKLTLKFYGSRAAINLFCSTSSDELVVQMFYYSSTIRSDELLSYLTFSQQMPQVVPTSGIVTDIWQRLSDMASFGARPTFPLYDVIKDKTM